METLEDYSGSTPLWRQLNHVLQERCENEYPQRLNPAGCTKRAAVALILRVRPRYPDQSTLSADECLDPGSSTQQRLNAFFAQEWVQRGDPEILFIKRAARQGDRWTGQVAFPGGGRDVTDLDDRMTSVRETDEEIGLNLNVGFCLAVGNLPQRVVTSMWRNSP